MVCYPQVSARTFHFFMTSGRNSPALFSCSDERGETAEYVVKFHGKIRSGAVSELIACELAKPLGIPVATGAVVDVDVRLGVVSPAVAEVLDAGDGPHFGSKHQAGGYSVFSGNYSLPNGLIPAAIDIFAWDMLLQNADRRKDNPNLLFNGAQFLVIDHELACAFESFIGGCNPFTLHGTQLERNHVLRFLLVRQITHTSFDGFTSRLAGLTVSQIEGLIAALPASWRYPQRTDAILAHFTAVLADVDKFKQSLLGIFS